MSAADLCRTATELLQRDNLTSAEARALWGDLQAAGAQLAERILAIRPGSAGGPGPVRRETGITGSVDDLAALDREHELLALQAEQVGALASEAHSRWQAARAREASANLPDMLAKLETDIAAAEDAEKVLAAAQQAVKRRFDEFRQLRSLAINAGLAVTTASSELANRLIDACPPLSRYGADVRADLTGQQGVRLGFAA